MEPTETSRAAIVDQATQWLVRLDAGQADLEDFTLWRESSARHAAIFAQVAATWTKTGELRTAGIHIPFAAAPPPPEVNAGSQAPVQRRRFLAGLSAGAAIAMVGTGGFFWTRPASAETGVGERRTVQLPDGCRVELNTETRISWLFSDNAQLWLEAGEAAIMLSARRSESVRLRSGKLQAELQTGRYSLRLLPSGECRLIVTEGRAHVSDRHGARLTLDQGHMVHETAQGLRPEPLMPGDKERFGAWQRGEILFDGMTLREALNEFNRYLPHRLELADPALGSIRLGGRFRTDDADGFIQSLQEGFGISARTEGQRILLNRSDAPA